MLLTSVSPFALAPVARQFGTASRVAFTAVAQQPADSVQFSAKKRKPGKNASLTALSQHFKSCRALNAEEQKLYFRDLTRAARAFGMTELLTANGKEIVPSVIAFLKPHLNKPGNLEKRLTSMLDLADYRTQSQVVRKALDLNGLALINAGLDVDARDGSGFTPLHVAASHNAKTIAKTLIAVGANVNARDSQGDSPLHCVAKTLTDRIGNHLDVVEVLIAAGADVNAKNDRGQDPILLALFNNRNDIAEAMCKNIPQQAGCRIS
jgi:ankyrin repeat protein